LWAKTGLHTGKYPMLFEELLKREEERWEMLTREELKIKHKFVR
jgi:hypothetical protein